MKTNLKKLQGNWDDGYALDKHTVRSVPIGPNQFGHMQFDTTYTEAGEAMYKLKYRADGTQVGPLALAIIEQIVPKFSKIGLVVPMAPSVVRGRQPVFEVSNKVAENLGINSFENIVIKQQPDGQQRQLKNIHVKAEKVKALADCFRLNEAINNEGCWNALVIDDIMATGASLEAFCNCLRGCQKIDKIFVATFTWK